jgi:hypothetical protein
MVRIGTHDGTFHADEALGCWLLRRTEARARRCAAAALPLRRRCAAVRTFSFAAR